VNHLLRAHAPITDAAWSRLDEEAAERLRVALGARALVDFSGPHGWQHSATNLGRVGPVVAAPADSVIARSRVVLPLAEVRADFDVHRDELDDHSRGAADVDLTGLDEAALRIAAVENAAVFHGWDELGIVGIIDASPHEPVARGDDHNRYAQQVATAVATLRRSGVGGPYGLALSPSAYTTVIETSEHGGYPLLDHLHKILGGPIAWVPGIREGVVMSTRGGDFLFESGQDFALGYSTHDAEKVSLYIEESFSFRVATPEAAVALAE
jgi:Uncharacterized protein, linocin/CFP29 homolog